MRRTILLPVALAALGFACADSPTAPSSLPGDPLPAAVRAAMTEAIADEYRAETVYEGVLADFGPLAPFTNVVGAEQRHSAALARLFESRGLPVPVNGWSIALVPHFPTIPAACSAGVTAERENIAIYDRYLVLEMPSDVRQVFESNRAASQFNHLPAFERCAP